MHVKIENNSITSNNSPSCHHENHCSLPFWYLSPRVSFVWSWCLYQQIYTVYIRGVLCVWFIPFYCWAISQSINLPVYSCIFLLMESHNVSSLGMLWLKMTWIFLSTLFCGHMFNITCVNKFEVKLLCQWICVSSLL